MEQTEKKSIKRISNKIGLALILYSIINLTIVIIDILFRTALVTIKEINSPNIDSIIDKTLDKTMESGTSMIIGVLLGVGFLLLFFEKSCGKTTLFQSKNKMTASKFFMFIALFMMMQSITTFVGDGIELILNLFDYTAIGDLESATSTSTTMSMFLYCGIVGPVAEELVYRGFVLRQLQKYGNIMAIIISSILFGIMHCNFYQLPLGFFVGLILGYIAINYSIYWSIALHIVNNLVFGDLLGFATAGLSSSLQDIIEWFIIGGFSIIGIIITVYYRGKIVTYYKENRTKKGIYKCVLTSIGIIIFILIEVFFMFSNLEVL